MSTQEGPSVQSTLEERRLDLEFEKAKWDYRKFIWGSVFAAISIATIPPSFQLATAYLESVRKDKELAIKQREFRDAYVKDFLSTALTQDIEVRIRFADYFANVSPAEYQAGWVEYRKGVRAMRDELRAQITSMEDLKQGLQQRATTRDGTEVRQLELKLMWAYAELGYAPVNRSVISNPRSFSQVVNELMRAVDSLDGARAVTLALKPPVRSDTADEAVAAIMPAGTISANQARFILRMRIQNSQNQKELEAWADALK